ncbi:MAG: nitrilase-related carbon-nitrogen hydrolase, partial [Bradymonadaceae bacterium]
MDIRRIAAGALNQTPLDWSGNRRRIATTIRRARDREVGVLCLPELCVTGYGCEDAFHSPDLADRALEVVADLEPLTDDIVVSVGLPIRFRGALYNATCLLADGDARGFVAKRHLAGDGVHYEPRWFNAWPTGERIELD